MQAMPFHERQMGERKNILKIKKFKKKRLRRKKLIKLALIIEI
jgi:hypothetical protein